MDGRRIVTRFQFLRHPQARATLCARLGAILNSVTGDKRLVKFARRMDKVEVSGIRRIFDLVQGMTDAVDLSLGQPHFDVPDPIKQAAAKAIQNGHNRYTVTQGIPELHEKLRGYLTRQFGFRDGGILVTAGAAGALFQAFMVLIDDGDEVLIPDPYFVLYVHLVNICGGSPILVDTYPDFRLTPERLKKQVTSKTKVLLFNNPVNPTGIAYTRDEVQAIAQFAKDHNLIVITDEIYDCFSYDFAHESMVRFLDDALLVGGFSKTYAVPGWRLGFAAGPRDMIEKMTTLQQFSFVCASSPAQRAGLVALDYDMGPYVEQYRRKRDFVCAGLRDRFELVKPQGAFYVFPKVPWGSDEEFVRAAVENKVLVIPGSACSRRRTHFRLSFAAEDTVLARGVEILNRIARR